jgi:hypothetical protein
VDSFRRTLILIEVGVVMSSHQGEKSDEVIWGTRAIAVAINRDERAAAHLLRNGELPGAKRIGGKWAFRPAIFFSNFEKGFAA